MAPDIERHEANELELKYLRRDLDALSDRMEREFVKRPEFIPLQKAFYSGIGIILSAFLLGLLAIVTGKV